MSIIEQFNIFNCEKATGDPIAYIFQQTNQNIINIIKKNEPASIIRIGGSDYDTYINGFNPILYELNGYFDKELDTVKETENFNNIKNLYIKSLKNCDCITVATGNTITKFGFVPYQYIKFPEKEKEFLINNVNKHIPICHWDFINLDYEHNFFLNVFPLLNNKSVCIISSFTEDIKEQLKHKEFLFKNKCENDRVGLVYKNFKYPDFKNIEYIKVPICYGTYKTRFDINCPYNNSKELLENLCLQISKTDSDIYLIGAGLYANLLCDYVKTHGKIGINCGSGIQLFFGILGNRFNYLIDQKVTNQYWKYPNLENCILYRNKEEMGGCATEGIQAYTKLPKK